MSTIIDPYKMNRLDEVSRYLYMWGLELASDLDETIHKVKNDFKEEIIRDVKSELKDEIITEIKDDLNKSEPKPQVCIWPEIPHNKRNQSDDLEEEKPTEPRKRRNTRKK